MSKALYITDIVITARRKREVLKIHKILHPVILTEDGRIPPEDLNQQLRMLVKDRVKKFDEWTYSYEVLRYVFSSKLYGDRL
jgi:hypothetical protein